MRYKPSGGINGDFLRFDVLVLQICKYCLYVTCQKKQFSELQVGKKDQETWKELQYCFQVRIGHLTPLTGLFTPDFLLTFQQLLSYAY